MVACNGREVTCHTTVLTANEQTQENRRVAWRWPHGYLPIFNTISFNLPVLITWLQFIFHSLFLVYFYLSVFLKVWIYMFDNCRNLLSQSRKNNNNEFRNPERRFSTYDLESKSNVTLLLAPQLHSSLDIWRHAAFVQTRVVVALCDLTWGVQKLLHGWTHRLFNVERFCIHSNILFKIPKCGTTWPWTNQLGLRLSSLITLQVRQWTIIWPRVDIQDLWDFHF